MGEYDECNPDNDLFLEWGRAVNTKPARQKGYYICPVAGGCGYDFLKAVARPSAVCPLCGQTVKRVLVMSPAEVVMLENRWREEEVYSDSRADRKECP